MCSGSPHTTSWWQYTCRGWAAWFFLLVDRQLHYRRRRLEEEEVGCRVGTGTIWKISNWGCTPTWQPRPEQRSSAFQSARIYKNKEKRKINSRPNHVAVIDGKRPRKFHGKRRKALARCCWDRDAARKIKFGMLPDKLLSFSQEWGILWYFPTVMSLLRWRLESLSCTLSKSVIGLLRYRSKQPNIFQATHSEV